MKFLTTIISTTLDSIGVTEIGLLSMGSDTERDFGTGVITAVCHAEGTQLVLIEILMIYRQQQTAHWHSSDIPSMVYNRNREMSLLFFITIYRIYSRISREILGKIICQSLGGRLIPGARHQTKKNST